MTELRYPVSDPRRKARQDGIAVDATASTIRRIVTIETYEKIKFRLGEKIAIRQSDIDDLLDFDDPRENRLITMTPAERVQLAKVFLAETVVLLDAYEDIIDLQDADICNRPKRLIRRIPQYGTYRRQFGDIEDSEETLKEANHA